MTTKAITTTSAVVAEVYRIDLVSGETALFTNYPDGVTVSGLNFQPIPIKRGKISYNTDLRVDSVDISFGIVGLRFGEREYSIIEAIRRGFFRGATVTIGRVNLSEPTPALVTLFEGLTVSGGSWDDAIFSIKVSSILDKLSTQFPSAIYSELCAHRLFDFYCGLVKEEYLQIAVVRAGSSTLRIFADCFLFASNPSGWFKRGVITFTSGDNANVSRTIQQHGDGFIDLIVPFPDVPMVDDVFSVWPGCDRTADSCDTKFDNYSNFLGFEYIPPPEILYG